jgi:general secretion pathway protein K
MRNTKWYRPKRYIEHSQRPADQRGIAIVTVLLVVALAATLAASVAWRELVAVRDVENQRVSVETMWVERAAVEWARATLQTQSVSSNVAYAGQAWSVPVKDTRLTDFLPRAAVAVNGELASAYISGNVEDAQAKFNLMDLVSRQGPSQPWQIDGSGIAAYRRLLAAISLDPALAQITADHILQSLSNRNPSRGWSMQLLSEQDLARVPGYDVAAVKILAPFVTVLPDYTAVNVNAAAPPTLVAAIPTLSAGQAQMLVERRDTAYFVNTSEVALVLSPTLTNAVLPAGAIVDVNSSYFIVHCRIHSARINTHIDTLIARYGIGKFTRTGVIWVHRLSR